MFGPDEMGSGMKDVWDRAEGLAQILSLVAVPLLAAVFGWHFQQEANDRRSGETTCGWPCKCWRLQGKIEHAQSFCLGLPA